MTTKELEKMARHGEASRVWFKQRFATPKPLVEDSHVGFVDNN